MHCQDEVDELGVTDLRRDTQETTDLNSNMIARAAGHRDENMAAMEQQPGSCQGGSGTDDCRYSRLPLCGDNVM